MRVRSIDELHYKVVNVECGAFKAADGIGIARVTLEVDVLARAILISWRASMRSGSIAHSVLRSRRAECMLGYGSNRREGVKP